MWPSGMVVANFSQVPRKSSGALAPQTSRSSMVDLLVAILVDAALDFPSDMIVVAP